MPTLECYCPRWGAEGQAWPEFAARVRDAGYDGVEWGFPRDVDPRELDAAWDACAKQDLPIIAQHWDTIDVDFPAHRRHYEAWWRLLEGRPLRKVNSQTGRDVFGLRQNETLFGVAAGFAEAYQTAVCHETHRGKWSFAAHVTRDYLERLPALRLTLDISHWVCVGESFLADQPAATALAISRADHLHARVGHLQGPQVPDPRVPAAREALDRHLAWWDQVWARHRDEGAEAITVTPEFGPAPYMTHLPGSGAPIADQWAINVFVMNLLRQRWA